jgi:menaquinone-dependent protoporphyrinogen IX oxidase
VDVKPVEDIKNISGYDGVVVGSSIRIMRLLGKTRRFLRKHLIQLHQLPLAILVSCGTMKEPTQENIDKTKSFIEPMVKVKEPLSLGLFGGCYDPEKMTGIFAKAMQNEPKVDSRDREKIRAWGLEILPMLSGEE